MTELYTLAGTDDGELSASMTEALARRFPDAEPTDSADAGSAAGEAEGGGESSPLSAPTPDLPEEERENVPAPEVVSVDGDQDLNGLPLDAPDPGFAISEDPGPEATETVETPSASTASTEDDLDLNDLFTRWTGRKPTSQEMVNLFGFIDQVAALTPEQNAQLQAVLNGQPIAQAPAAQAPIATPSAPTSIDLPDDLDPSAKALLAPLYEKIASLEANTQAASVAQEQARLQAQQAQYAQAASVASQQFVSKYGSYLTPTDMVLLESRAARSGQIGVFLAQNNQDMTKAYGAMLEATMLADADMRSRVVQAETAAAQKQAAEDAKRTALAASVSASSSPIAPDAPAKSKTATDAPLRAGTRSKAELAKAQREASTAAAKALAELTGMQSASVPSR